MIHPLQSSEWGQVRKSHGVEVVRLNTGDGEYQFSIHPIPFLNYQVGYLPRSAFPTNETLKALIDYGRKNRIVFFQIEPNVEKIAVQKTGFSDLHFIPSPHPLFPKWTQILDLTLSEEELLKNMKSKTRYNINLAKKKGVVIREESTDEGFKIFSKLYFETCKRQHYFGHNLAYHQAIWDQLGGSIAHILIAYYEHIPLAAYELFFFDGILYYPYGGTSNLHRNLMASNLLMWEAIRLGKTMGAKSFDMWGSLPADYDNNHDWAGFTRFKEGYGTRFVEMAGSFDLVIHPLYYKMYHLLYTLREKYLSLRA